MQDDIGACSDGQRMPPFARAAFDALVCRRAARLLELALRAEADDYVERHRELRDAAGRALVVRNGLATERHVATMAGTLAIRAPRVLDRRPGESFVSAILPPYARTSQRLAAALPELALRGLGAGSIASGEAVLRALVGPSAARLSVSIAERLDGAWAAECRAWLDRQLDGIRFTEMWAGLVREGGTCSYRAGCLALVGVTADGASEVIAIGHGFADDVGWWQDTLRALSGRGLGGPMLVMGDHDLGIWHSLDAVYPFTLQMPHRWQLVVDRTTGWQASEVSARHGGGLSDKPASMSEDMLDGAAEGTSGRELVDVGAEPIGSPGRGQAIDASGRGPAGANRNVPARFDCVALSPIASRWPPSAATSALRIGSASTAPRAAMRDSLSPLHAHRPAQSLTQEGRRRRDRCPRWSMSAPCCAAAT